MSDPEQSSLPQPGTDALQDAALQMIAAARAFLSAAEAVVREPGSVRDVAGTMTSMARSVLRSFAGDSGRPESDREPDPPIEHIDVA